MRVGEDVFISPNAELKLAEQAIIGNHVSIDSFVYCTVPMTVGDYVHIASHCSIIGGAMATFTMGNFSALATGCRVICASDEHLGAGLDIPWVPKEYRDSVVNKPIVIEDFAIVCAGAILLPGVTIAEGSVVGAGCVVRRSTKPWMVYVGDPPLPCKERSCETMKQYAKEMGYEVSP